MPPTLCTISNLQRPERVRTCGPLVSYTSKCPLPPVSLMRLKGTWNRAHGARCTAFTVNNCTASGCIQISLESIACAQVSQKTEVADLQHFAVIVDLFVLLAGRWEAVLEQGPLSERKSTRLHGCTVNAEVERRSTSRERIMSSLSRWQWQYKWPLFPGISNRHHQNCPNCVFCARACSMLPVRLATMRQICMPSTGHETADRARLTS